MGIVCEFYRIDDNVINTFLQDPIKFESYFYDNYVNPDGQFHDEGNTYFYSDKAWDIANFLIQQNDTSAEKLLDGILGTSIKEIEGISYIKSEDVLKMNNLLIKITSQQIEEAYDEEKMKNPYIYNAGWFTKEENWDYILRHVNTFFEVFEKAAEHSDGIIISRG
nr:DUF1877 family protein [uncultured Flavobacterium sp.]